MIATESRPVELATTAAWSQRGRLPSRIAAAHGSDQIEPFHDDDPAGWVVKCLCGLPFRGATPTEALLSRRVHALDRYAAALGNELDRLGNVIADHLPDEPADDGYVTIAVRALQQYLEHPNGRLEPWVRMVIADLEGETDNNDLPPSDLLVAVRTTLKNALLQAPRPGGGPAPVYESDDIDLVRSDRDRFRADLEASSLLITQMFAAATGHDGSSPVIGVVEDLRAVHDALVAAKRALTVALSHRCDGHGSVPREGTPAFAAIGRLVDDVVAAVGRRLHPGKQRI